MIQFESECSGEGNVVRVGREKRGGGGSKFLSLEIDHINNCREFVKYLTYAMHLRE